jgi:hypothetical protein
MSLLGELFFQKMAFVRECFIFKKKELGFDDFSPKNKRLMCTPHVLRRC